MKQTLTIKQVKQSIRVNRIFYFLYLLLVIYLLAKGDLEWAIVNFGIAMAFDPFDYRVSFTNRPTYQKIWLYAHVLICVAGFIYLVFIK